MPNHPPKKYHGSDRRAWSRLTWAWLGLLGVGGLVWVAVPRIGIYAAKPDAPQVVITLPTEPDRFAAIRKRPPSSNVFDITEVINPDAPAAVPATVPTAQVQPAPPGALALSTAAQPRPVEIARAPDGPDGHTASRTPGPKTITLTPPPAASGGTTPAGEPSPERELLPQLATAKVIRLEALPEAGPSDGPKDGSGRRPENGSVADPFGTAPGARPAPPNPSLYRQTPNGPMPHLSADGPRAAHYYVRAYDGRAPGAGSDANEIGLIVGGLGLDSDVTRRAIEELPPEVSLAFAPYAKDLAQWAEQARMRGHELLLELPMEHTGKDTAQLGSAALLTGQSWPEKRVRLDWLLTRFAGYFAVTNYRGQKFSADSAAIGPVLDYIDAAGIAYIDDTGAETLLNPNYASGFSTTDRLIPPNASDFAAHFLRLEAAAHPTKKAIGKTYATPANIDAIITWAHHIDPAISRLVPVSHLIHQNNR